MITYYFSYSSSNNSRLFHGDLIGNTEGQSLEANELGEEQSALEENNNDVAESFFQEIEINFEAVDKYLQMDETWIVHREITHYLSAQQKLESD